ncbi:MAG TPA: hypothetical protein VFU69_10885, partial [Ktedonobacterales bacterium]|nr:hypothetical protein [Ktedonobacterales bacterium]
MTEAEARKRLDAYYAEVLDLPPEAFTQPGIRLALFSNPRATTSLFRNAALIVHAPTGPDALRACAVVANQRLLEPLRRLLSGRSVGSLFEASALEQLTRLVRGVFPGASLSPGGALLIARFVAPETFRPFRGPESARVR